jgi:putative ABC transport system permease protein
MGIYFKMSLAYLKKNKLRTLLLILGVVLGVVLIFGTNVIKESDRNNIVKSINKLYGGYHVEFRDLKFESNEKLKNDENTSKITIIQNLGNIVDQKGNSFYLKSANEDYMNRMSSKLVKGRIPKNNNEIVMDKKALEAMNSSIELSSNLDFKIKKKYKDSEGNSKFYTIDKTFKLVGVTEKPKGFYDTIYELEAFTYGNDAKDNIIAEDAITYNSLLSLKSGWKNIAGQSENLMMKHNLGKTSYLPNVPLVQKLTDVEIDSDNTNAYKSQALIIITSAIFVFNIFNITLNETIKEMGLLRLVGSSKKNIRLIIIYQAIIIMVVGILLGLMIGVGYSYVGINIADSSLYKEAAMKPKLYISNESIMKAIIPGVLSAIVSCIIPIIKVSNISPMGSIRKTDKLKGSNRSYKLNKFLSKRFGFYGFMGLKNIGRNKTRAFISMVSIALGGYVFITTFSSMQGEVTDKIKYMQNLYDIEMQFFGGVSDIDNLKYTDSDVNEIKKINSVKSIDAIHIVDGLFEFKKNDINKEFTKYNGIKEKDKIECDTTLTLYENDYINNKLKSFVEEGNVDDIVKATDGYPNIAVYNYFYDIVKDSTIKKVYTNMKVGDIITIKIPVIEDDKTVYKESKVRVCAILKPDWIALGDGNFSPTFKIFASNKNSKYLAGEQKYTKLGINLENPYDKAVNKDIEKISNNIPLSKFKSKLSFYEMQQNSIEKYHKSQLSIIVLVLIIAGINIYCTIRTNLLIRKKEISTLRAIGLSMKNMRKMVTHEALAYAILSFMITLIPTTINLVKFVNWNNNAYKNFGIEHFMSFTFPVKESITFFLLSIAVCLLAVITSNREFKKMNITEGIKDND